MSRLGYARIDYGAKAPNPKYVKKPKRTKSMRNMTKREVRYELACREKEQGRKGKRYYKWRRAVLERDRHTCQDCGAKSKHIKLHAHHLLWWSKFPALRFKLDNGKTLCRDCHIRIHPWLDWRRYKQLMKIPLPSRPQALPKQLKTKVIIRKRGSANTERVFKINQLDDTITIE